ncbi:MAG: hypothetical protein Q9211_003130 [Gyalolechia sp. 1 TL-2023]
MASNKKMNAVQREAFSLQSKQSEQTSQLPLQPDSSASLLDQATKLLDALTDLEAGRSLKCYDHAFPPDLLRFNIGTCTLSQLRDYVDQRPDLKAWFEDKLRYEYTTLPSGDNEFSIKISSRPRETVSCHVAYEINKAHDALVRDLRDSQEDVSIVQEIQDLDKCGTANFALLKPYEGTEIAADMAWATSAESEYPIFVLENAYSEPTEHLREKARMWVQGTDGSVQWVLGIKQIIPEDPREPFLKLELRHFLGRESTMPDRLRNRVLPILLSPLPEKIVKSIEKQAKDAEAKKARKGRKTAALHSAPVPVPTAQKKRATSRYDLRRNPTKPKS